MERKESGMHPRLWIGTALASAARGAGRIVRNTFSAADDELD
jgi:hypothetical protein